MNKDSFFVDETHIFLTSNSQLLTFFDGVFWSIKAFGLKTHKCSQIHINTVLFLLLL